MKILKVIICSRYVEFRIEYVLMTPDIYLKMIKIGIKAAWQK